MRDQSNLIKGLLQKATSVKIDDAELFLRAPKYKETVKILEKAANYKVEADKEGKPLNPEGFHNHLMEVAALCVRKTLPEVSSDKVDTIISLAGGVRSDLVRKASRLCGIGYLFDPSLLELEEDLEAKDFQEEDDSHNDFSSAGSLESHLNKSTHSLQ